MRKKRKEKLEALGKKSQRRTSSEQRSSSRVNRTPMECANSRVFQAATKHDLNQSLEK